MAADGTAPEPPRFRRRLFGVDRSQVHEHLEVIADRTRALEGERDALARRVAEMEAAPFDEERARAALGEEVTRRLGEARDAAAADVEATKQTCRDMLDETRQVRERMLSDLAHRRDAARSQIARLHAERDRLLGVLAEARAAVAAAEASVEALEAEPDETGVSLAPVTQPVPAVRAGAPASPPVLAEPVSAEEVLAEPVSAEEAAVPVRSDLVADPALALAGRHTEVDALFERIRAGGATTVVARSSASVAPPTAPDRIPSTAGGPEQCTARNRSLAPLDAALARRLKRVLADEQNDVLDTIRRDGVPAGLDAAVGPLERHAGRFREAAEQDLTAAANLGVLAATPGVDDPVVRAVLDTAHVLDAVLERVGDDLVVPFRERLDRCLIDAAGEPVEVTISMLRATYREWKTQRIDEIAADLVLAAYGAGVYAAFASGTPVCWLVDPSAPPCPDAEDNALAGSVPAGTPFPTGHTHPPAHPGCRCLLARAGR